MFPLLYELGLHLYACLLLPKLLFQFRKYRGSIVKRLGVGFPKIDKIQKKLIWIHAVSLGETKAVAPLIKRLKTLENAPLILLSTTTQTGYAEGLKSSPAADHHVFLPFDFSYVIRSVFRRAQPDLVILTETDFWYNFQTEAKKLGASLVVINGKISQRSTSRLSKLPFLARRLLGSVDHFYLQGEVYRERFAQLKIPFSKLTVTGNLKMDCEVEMIDGLSLKKSLGLDQEVLLTLGSTHDPEERLWIAALKQLWKEFPQLKVLLVPRHPERFEEVAKLLADQQVSFARFSSGRGFTTSPLLLIDTMGFLKKCYQISDIAFVGGSLTPKVGGHNILEPAFYGTPILFGPYMHGQPDFLSLVTSYHAGLQVSEETLISTTRQLLLEPSLRHQLGANGKKMTTVSRGALDKTFAELLSLLKKEHP